MENPLRQGGAGYSVCPQQHYHLPSAVIVATATGWHGSRNQGLVDHLMSSNASRTVGDLLDYRSTPKPWRTDLVYLIASRTNRGSKPQPMSSRSGTLPLPRN